MGPSRTPDAEKVAALRQLLPATGAGIYLDTASAGPLPAETAAAMREADEWELRVGRAVVGRDEDLAQREDEARAVLAALIGADPDDVRPTAGLAPATLAGLLALDWQPADRLALLDDVEPPVRAAAESAASALGLRIEVAAEPKEALRTGPKRLLAAAVSSVSGRRLPLADLAQELQRQGGDLLVDASALAGAAPLAANDVGAEMIVLATDRWCLGPDGAAAVWLRGLRDGRREPVLARLPRTQLLGLARSLGWLAMYVGLAWVYERTAALVARLATGLAAIEGVEMLTPTDARAAIVSFRLPPAWSAEEAAEELGRRVFAIVPALPGQVIRASVAWYNTEEELDRFVAAVDELAGHTPESLPRRPSLTIL